MRLSSAGITPSPDFRAFRPLVWLVGLIAALCIALVSPALAQERQQIAAVDLSNISVMGNAPSSRTFTVPAGSRVTEIETAIGVSHRGSSYGSETVLTLIAPGGQRFEFTGPEMNFASQPGYYRATSRLQVNPPVLNAGGTWTVELSDTFDDRANPDYITDSNSGIVLYDLPNPELSLSGSSAVLVMGTTIDPIQASATGGVAPYTYSISPALPAGLTLNASTGALTGTPEAGSPETTYTITAVDSRNLGDEATLTLTVEDRSLVLTLSDSSISAIRGTAITPVTASASGGDENFSFSITPALPSGLSIDAVTGTISGTPTVASPVTGYTITLTDGNGYTETAGISIGVEHPPLGLSLSQSYLRLTRGVAIDPAVTATITGGSGTVSFSVSPMLPAGIELDPVTGTISGTPGAILAATAYTVTATDQTGPSLSAILTISVENDDERVAEAFEQATTRFMAARIDRMLASEPRGYRLENRGDTSGNGITSRSTQDGTDLSFSAGRLSADGLWFLWIEGEYSEYRYSHTGEATRKGDFGLVSAGFDYLLNPDLTLGMMVQVDRMSETAKDASDISGNGWMVGPYIAGRFSTDLYYTARIAYGRSDNDAALDVFGGGAEWFRGGFDTERSLARASVYGIRELSSGVTVSPKLDLAWMRESQQDYTVSDGVSSVAVDGLAVEVWRLTLSSRFEGPAGQNLRAFVEPSLAWDFAGSGTEESDDLIGALELGLRSDAASAWQSLVALRYEGIGADDREAVAVRLNLNRSF